MSPTRLAGLVGVLLAALGVVLANRPVTAGETKPAFPNPFAAKFKEALKPKDAGLDEFLMSVAFSPDGQTLAVASFFGGVKLYDVASGKSTALAGAKEVHTVAFSPDGKTLACCCSGGFGVKGLRPE